MPKKNMLVWSNYMYDYVCGNCGYCPNTEQDMTITPSLKKCPKCGKKMINPGVKGDIIR